LNHDHQIKKTHITIVEFDDVIPEKLGRDSRYFGEGNSKGRKIDFNFEYCLGCSLRLLDGQPIMTKDILENEFESIVKRARKGNFTSLDKTTMQHTDFETFERLIQKALAFGKFKDKIKGKYKNEP
jgi:hypothetical protein